MPKTYATSTSGGGVGNVVGPAANTDAYIPQWNGANSKTLKDGLVVPAGGIAGLTALADKAPIASPTFTGTPAAPTAGAGVSTTQLATTEFVQVAVRSTPGKEASEYATIAALPAIVYANGSSGVGATLTGVAVGALGVDSQSPAVGNRILVKNQVSTFQNGIYTVTATGSGIAVFVLTRALDFDQQTDILTGAQTYVVGGTTLAGTTWDVNSADSPVIGTDAITFVQSAGPGSVVQGNGITITGTSIAINTAVTADLSTAQTLTNKTLTSPKINENVAITATATELNYTDGVTSAIQTQLNAKAASLGADDNYVTDAEKVVIGNTSGTNTGNQTLPVKASGAEINTSTDDAKFVTAKAIHDSFIGEQGGWITLGACTYEASDDPTYTFSFASDMTAILSPGMRIKLTDSSVCYFIITKVGAYSGGKTIITGYGGTDYNLTGGAITLPYYSTQKAPQGFPLDPTKWQSSATDTAERSQTSPTQNQWYNLGTISISVPIGAWKLYYKAVIAPTDDSGTGADINATLSTANNSESDTDFSSYVLIGGASGNITNFISVYIEKVFLLATKTTYYLNAKTPTASQTRIGIRGDLAKTIVGYVCAYL